MSTTQPRRIETAKRAPIFDKIMVKLDKYSADCDKAIEDLSKDHVDDKAQAKTLLASFRKLKTKLEAAKAVKN